MRKYLRGLAVKRWGNTAGVTVPKRFLGRSVTVVIHDADDAAKAAEVGDIS
jgi:antitoxin component of MazEF toxin-antitoxin module